MYLPALIRLLLHGYRVAKSPESRKPMPTRLFWAAIALTVAFFIVFGWLFITRRI